MAVISNSSPLILYARVGRLDLLPALFGEVFIPVAVHDEVVAASRGRAGGAAVAAASWLAVRAVRGLAASHLVSAVLTALDRGEAEALALSLELAAEDDGRRRLPVLLDDRRGRRAAAQLGIEVYGSAGILLVAKERGLVTAVQPLLDELRHAGLYLNDRIRHHVLTLAGESGAD